MKSFFFYNLEAYKISSDKFENSSLSKKSSGLLKG